MTVQQHDHTPDPAASETIEATRYEYPFHRPSATELPPLYRELRSQCPVASVRFPSGDPGFVASRHADARTVLADPRFSRAATLDPDAPKLSDLPVVPGSLFSMDPPEHTRLRKLVLSEFTARRVRALEPRIQQITDELLDSMERGGAPADLNTALAFPLPVMVICELLGIPFEDRDKFRGWSDAFVSLKSHDTQEMLVRRQSLVAYLTELVASKREHPGDDLLSGLVQARDELGKLSEWELVVMGITLLVAGHETTVSMIGMCVFTLLRHPEQLAALREHPETLPNAIEELLRINPIGDGGPLRITLEDVDLAGTVIPKGSAVLAAICSASRDEAIFTDGDPDQFDHARPTAGEHLAFGHGPHYCLGASLARAELRIAIGSLIKRFPGLRLAGDVADVRMTTGMMVHGLTELPVVW
ncbi:MAG TPA: cytochrome P450 [Jatrophihabitantaceae bacterium]|jgi:nocardicin N-oxygenase